jgi:hypothetical protein
MPVTSLVENGLAGVADKVKTQPDGVSSNRSQFELDEHGSTLAPPRQLAAIAAAAAAALPSCTRDSGCGRTATGELNQQFYRLKNSLFTAWRKIEPLSV